MLRDPGDRFIVNYYFRRAQAQNGELKKNSPIFDRNGEVPRTPVDFLDMLERRNCEKWRETQCRFFGGVPTAEHANKVIEREGVHVFSFGALNILEQWLKRSLGSRFEFVAPKRVNRNRPPLDEVYKTHPTLRRRLEARFEQDFHLYHAYQSGASEALNRAIDVCKKMQFSPM